MITIPQGLSFYVYLETPVISLLKKKPHPPCPPAPRLYTGVSVIVTQHVIVWLRSGDWCIWVCMTTDISPLSPHPPRPPVPRSRMYYLSIYDNRDSSSESVPSPTPPPNLFYYINLISTVCSSPLSNSRPLSKHTKKLRTSQAQKHSNVVLSINAITLT